MILLAGTVRLPVENIEKAREAMQTMVLATRQEPGCVSYAFSFDVVDEGLVRVFEIFADDAAFQSHIASPHMAAWRAAGAGLGIGERNLSRYYVEKFEKI